LHESLPQDEWRPKNPPQSILAREAIDALQLAFSDRAKCEQALSSYLMEWQIPANPQTIVRHAGIHAKSPASMPRCTHLDGFPAGALRKWNRRRRSKRQCDRRISNKPPHAAAGLHACRDDAAAEWKERLRVLQTRSRSARDDRYFRRS